MSRDTDRASYWTETASARRFPPLEDETEADVAIVGAGIVGVTAAYLLAKAGRDVLLVEREQVGRRDTGHTTAHLSYVVDTPLPKLVEKHGVEKAGEVWRANAFALDFIERTAREEGIDCDFARIDGILYAPRAEDVGQVKRIRELAAQMGFEPDEHPPSEVPFAAEVALRWPDQARFHPMKYLAALVERITRAGGRIHEDTAVHGLESGEGGGALLKLGTGGRVRANHVLLASHSPFAPKTEAWPRLHPFRSYVLGAVVARDSFPDALFWDTLEPFHYARLQAINGEDLLIFGGEDHPIAQVADEHERWERLERTLAESLDIETDVVWRWSAQDARSPDLLPAIGLNARPVAGERIATGFDGSGMTYGTLAGWMLAEQVMGRTTPWDGLFDPQRTDPAIDQHIRAEDDEMPRYDETRRAGAIDPPQVADLVRGQGALVKLDGDLFAVHRDERGTLVVRKPKCMHMGCLVRWNGAEGSWDCGCHGSRYAPDGHVLDGPAPHGLHDVDPEVMQRLHERIEGGRREERAR